MEDRDKRTAFHLACIEGRLEIVRWLLECEPTLIGLKDNYGKTGLDYVKENNHAQTVDCLSSYVDRINSIDHQTAIVENDGCAD